MSSFATIYSLAKMSGNNIRAGLIYGQFQKLSAIFPYFEENYSKHLIHSWYCGHFCNINWLLLKNIKPLRKLQHANLSGIYNFFAIFL